MAWRGTTRVSAGERDDAAWPASDSASMLAVYDLSAGPGPDAGYSEPAVDLSSRPPAAGHRLWAAGLAAVVAAGALAAIVAHNPGVPPMAAVPIPAVVNTVADAIPGAEAVDGLGSAPVTRVVIGSWDVYFLQSGLDRIGRFSAGADMAQEFAPVPAGATWLRVDDAAGLVWVVCDRPTGTLVRVYELARSLGTLSSTPFLDVEMAGHVTRSAAVDGRLWLINEGGLRYLQPVGTTVRTGSLPIAHTAALAADQSRDRLLVTTELGSQTVLYDVDTSTSVLPAPRRLATIPLKAVTVAPAGNYLWLSGVTATGPAITRLDPVSGGVLVPPRSSSLSASGSLRAGGDVLWWRAADGLRCLDPDRGTVVGAWPQVDGPVVSAVGYIYAVVGGVLQRLASTNRCPG